MNFTQFQTITFPNKAQLLKLCKMAEQNIMIDPYEAVTASRTALEVLCKGLVTQHHLSVPVGSDGRDNLFQLSQACVENGYIQNDNALQKVRRDANPVIHAATEPHIQLAKDVVRSLFLVMQQAFHVNEGRFDGNKIPIGEYEILRRVPKARNEVVMGDYNYFTRSEMNGTYYLQVYKKSYQNEAQQKLKGRTEDVHKIIKGEKKRRQYLLHTNILNTSEDSDRFYMVYEVHNDSILLSELDRPLDAKNAIRIAFDLLGALQDMKRMGSGLHHRNIQPGCVIITPEDDEYQAALVNMETAKIEQADNTVIGSIKDTFKDNIYLPREVRDYKDGQQIDWEKADVHSVAKILVYCLDSKLVEADMEIDPLYDLLPETVVIALNEIFGNSLALSLSIREFKGILEEALEEL